MEEDNNGTPVSQPEKMSYEKLEELARQLSEQNRMMSQKFHEMNLTNMFKRLDFLFRVIETPDMFDVDFVENCRQEIQDLIAIPEEEPEVKTEE